MVVRATKVVTVKALAQSGAAPDANRDDGFCASDDACVLFIAFESPLDAVPIESAAK